MSASPMAGQAATQLVALPPWGDPRYLLPIRGTSARLAAQIFTAGQSSLTSRALRGLARSGLLPLLGTASPSPVDSAVIEELRTRLVWTTDVAISFGPARANAKPVIALLKGDEVAAVAKVGSTPLTRRLVGHETEVLHNEAMRSHTLYEAPTVLDSFDVGASRVLVVTSFDLRTSVPVDLSGARRAEWIEVARAIAGPDLPRPLADTDWWTRLESRIGAVEHPSPQLRHIGDEVARLGGRTVAPSASHGDFTRWNARRLERNWAVWDWERHTRSALWGFDVLHWEVFDRPRGGITRSLDRVVRDHGRILAGTGIGPDQSGLVAFLYLADLAIRFENDRQAAAAAVTAAALRAARGVNDGA